VCRELRRRSDVPIIMLTARGTEIDRVVGLELGADDYVVKPFSGAEVIARMRAVLRRRAPVARDTVEVGPLRVDLAGRRAWLDGRELTLSRKEQALLAELVRHAGGVVTREELMGRVWDENWWGSTKTLDVHINSIRRKLGEQSGDASRIATIRGIGYRLDGMRPDSGPEA